MEGSVFFCKKVENGGDFCKKWKMGGVLCKKKCKMGGVFCKKVDLSSMQGALCTVSVFLFYILLIWVGAYGPDTTTTTAPI